MSLDVLLEAADVLEKQKVASILTSMHEYDNTFGFSKRNEKKVNYRPPCSSQSTELKPCQIIVQSACVDDGIPRSPSGRRIFSARRRLATTKLTTKYTVNSDRFNITDKEGWHSRSMHNQMEKNRRAQLRIFMNNLRDVIPAGNGQNRRKLTTLTLLQNARAYIESLKENEEQHEHDKQKLWRRHLRLREILCQLSGSAIVTVPGIPITPGIRKYPTPPGSEMEEVEAKMVVEGVSDLSDESDAHSIGTLSNSDGGEAAVSPDKEL